MAFFAWFLGLLQVVTALHFALVPHAFGAGLASFVHVDEHARAEQAPAVRVGTRSHAVALVQGGASCVTDSCPIGFAGHSVLELARFELAVALPAPLALTPPVLHSHVRARASVLLSAPKTSPPV